MRMQNRVVASGLKIVANAVIILALGLLAYGSYLKYHASGSLNWLGLLIVNSIFVVMYIAKREATSISQSPALWLLAFAGTCMPLALRPTTTAASWVSAGNILQLIGLIAIAAAILSLRRSFGIVPANRGIRTQGIYNVVRHPLYASELFWMLGFAIANPSAWNILIWLCDCALQFTRACAEERFLSGDPAYLHYRARVRYRLVPLVL
jgi:protein-S-isoprenylcysteine O-methyltransferase Ste14